MAKKRQSAPNISQDALARARAELYGDDIPVEDDDVIEVQAPKRMAKQNQADEQFVYSSTKRTMTRDELAAEYGYVLRDLTSMAILAAILFAVLVAVSLIVI